ncbi:hypothetical protein WDW37_03890 [Bdellovibrionota bacterium FG-1]
MQSQVSERELKNVIRLLKRIEPLRDHGDSQWLFYFPVHSRKWQKLLIVLYDSNYYFSFAHSDFSLCYPGEKDRIDWDAPELRWIIDHVPGCIEDMSKKGDFAYRKVVRTLPKRYRWGIVPRKAALLNCDDLYRAEKELGKRNTDELVHWIEKQGSEKVKFEQPMTLKLYLEYCRIAYLANADQLKLTGKETGLGLYKRFADNRHDGLLEIDPDSADAFHAWYHGGRGGGHPWEVYRGGNTTHIDLGVTTTDYEWREKKETRNYTIFLHGLSTGRLVETAHIALAFIRKGMPFTFLGAEEMRRKLLALDNLGIVPEWYSLHRANQDFIEGLHVYDCLHWTDLSAEERRKLLAYVTWLPLEVILPRV